MGTVTIVIIALESIKFHLENMEQILALLKTIDADGSGTVSVEECKDFLNRPLEEARQCVELLLSMAGPEGEIGVKNLIKLVTTLRKCEVNFDSIDTNNDGRISPEELEAELVASGDFTEEQIEQITENWIPEKTIAYLEAVSKCKNAAC